MLSITDCWPSLFVIPFLDTLRPIRVSYVAMAFLMSPLCRPINLLLVARYQPAFVVFVFHRSTFDFVYFYLLFTLHVYCFIPTPHLYHYFIISFLYVCRWLVALAVTIRALLLGGDLSRLSLTGGMFFLFSLSFDR